jgi:hypothetical protein
VVTRVVARVAVSCALAACAAACGPAEDDEEDPPNPLVGFYLVPEGGHTETEPCAAAGGTAEVPDPPITAFKLDEDSFFLASILGFHDCSSTNTEDGCDEDARLDYSGLESDNRVDITFCSCANGDPALGTEDRCSVGGTRGTWEKTDDGVKLELVTKNGSDLAEEVDEDADCDPSALYDKYEDQLECTSEESLTGTKQ